MPPSPSIPLLKGLRVLELANVLAGPATGMFCAELGAEVLKLEHPQGGDPTRGWTVPEEQPWGGVSAYFAATNWGKKSLTVDLTKNEGQTIAQGLAAKADVVIAAFKPGDDARLGVDATRLRAANPKLIYAQVSAYGIEDPRPGFDAVIQAEAGFMHLNGDPEGPPTKMPVALMDLLAAHQLKEALLLALLKRERFGEGSHIQIALFDAALASLANQATNHLVAGRNPGRMGSGHPNVVPYGTLYAAQDGKHFVLAIGTDRQFTALARALGLEGLAKDPRFATNGARVQHRDALDEILHRAFGAENSATLERALAAAKVPFGPVNDLTEAFAHPRAQRTALTGVLANGQPLRAVSSLAFEGGIPRQNPSAPPALGAHTDEVLRTTLGYSESHLAVLRAQGVLGALPSTH
ncbi:MAG: CaiB/BaiF CoA-transferase family protein [Pseudomonadota bacterium]|nr:CaiB/BaiF CoA-transferase family protein [Pseudomonadota bacterium]